jgi:DNA-binding MarR family transcriptional regulator
MSGTNEQNSYGNNEGRLDIMANVRPSLAVLKSWRQIYQTDNLLRQCQDQICSEYGLTVEQYAVLIVLNYTGGSARITDIAQWLIRSTNSVTMIVDRMVKLGLVKRTRDRTDRRVVNVTASSKGNAAVEQAHVAILEFVSKIFQPLSNEDNNTLFRLLGTVKYEIVKYGNPGADIKEAKRIESKQLDGIVRWMSGGKVALAPKARGQAGGKTATV